MSAHRPAPPPTTAEVTDRLLPTAAWRRRRLAIPGRGIVFLVERGAGPPLVLVHGSGSPGTFFAPLLRQLDGFRMVVPDRPGHGRSEPFDDPPRDIRRAAVAWIDALLDALDLHRVALLGHSMGGLWSLWYAMARPRRVDRLVVIGPPQLPGTRAPLPYRVMATPGLWPLFRRLSPPSAASVRSFATAMGEGDAILGHPDLVDLLVAEGRDAVSAAATTHEVRAIVSPVGLVTPTGFRHGMRIRSDDLRSLETDTLVVWGRDEPLGGPEVAAHVVAQLPHGRLAVVPGGHAPWLDGPGRVARTIATFLSADHDRPSAGRAAGAADGARSTHATHRVRGDAG